MEQGLSCLLPRGHHRAHAKDIGLKKKSAKTSGWPTGTVVGLRKLCECGIFLRDTAIQFRRCQVVLALEGVGRSLGMDHQIKQRR